MKKVRDRSSSLFRAGVTSVASPIGKLGQKTLDAGQSEVKQLWGFIERAFYPKEGEGDGDEEESQRKVGGGKGGGAGGEEAEEQAWEESPNGLEEVNIFLDHLGGVSDDSVSTADGADLSSGSSTASSSSSSSGKDRRTGTLSGSGGSATSGQHSAEHASTAGLSSSAGGTSKPAGDGSGNNAFVVKIKKGKDMAHKIMFYGVEKVTHLGRGGHKKKKDPDGLVEPRAVVGLCGKRGAEPALIEVSMGCIISCPLQLQGGLALPKKFKNRRMLTKNTPRVLFGKQEGWVLELYTPLQLVDASSKAKHKRSTTKHEPDKEKRAKKDKSPAKEKPAKGDTLSGSNGSVEAVPINKETTHKKRSASQDQTSDHEKHPDSPKDKHMPHKGKEKVKGQPTQQIEPTDAQGDTIKQRSGSIVTHNMNSSHTAHEDATPTADIDEEWLDLIAADVTNWQKLELAARTPHQILAWRQFFQTGSTDDGRKEISGFLWVKHKDLWDRYYCMANQEHIEWLKPGAANLIPLTSLTNLRRGILTEKEQHKLQTKKKKEDWDKSYFLSKIRMAKYKLSLLKQNDTLFSFVTPSRNILVAIATHIIAQKGLDNLITHNRTLLDEVDSAKAVAAKSEFQVKRNTTSSIRKRSEVKGKEPTLVPIHRRTVSNSDTVEYNNPEAGSNIPAPPSGDRAQRNQQVFLDSVGEDGAPGEHYLRKSTIEETKETTKLRNEMRDAHERAILEMGKTAFGNSDFDKCNRLAESNSTDKSNKDFFILSLDGGGLRGVILTTLLVRLVEVFPDLMEKVDLFAGVSAGSIVASSLATGRSPVFMQKMLRILGPILFMGRNVRQFHGYPLRQAKYSMLNLKIVLEESLRGATLGSCPRNLLISTFLLDNQKEGSKRSWDPRVYHNLPRDKAKVMTDSEEEEEDLRTEEDILPANSNADRNLEYSLTVEHAPTALSKHDGRRFLMGRSQSEVSVAMRSGNPDSEMAHNDLQQKGTKRRMHKDGRKSNIEREGKSERRRGRGGKKENASTTNLSVQTKDEKCYEANGRDGAQDGPEGKGKEVTKDEYAKDTSKPNHQRSGSLPQSFKTDEAIPEAEAQDRQKPDRRMVLRWPSRKISQTESDFRPATTRESLRSGLATDELNDELAGEGMHSSYSGFTRSSTDMLMRERLGHSRQASIESFVPNRMLSSKLRKPSQKQLVPSSQSNKRDPSELESNSKINSKSGKETVEALEVNNDTLLMDLVLASAAAPTFFPSHRCHVDGAIVSNNPSLAAITTVLSPDTIGTPKMPSRVHVLSIGTGYIKRFIETNNDHDWGVLQWAPWLSEIMLYSAQMNATKLSATLLGDNYHRLDPHLDKAIPMDDPALMALLEEKAMEVDLTPTIAWIKRHVYGEQEPTAADDAGGTTKRKKTKRKKKKARPPKGDARTSSDDSEKKASQDSILKGDDVHHSNNMHWGTDAWFATQRMWEG